MRGAIIVQPLITGRRIARARRRLLAVAVRAAVAHGPALFGCSDIDRNGGGCKNAENCIPNQCALKKKKKKKKKKNFGGPQTA
jgi:hypothetical protein